MCLPPRIFQSEEERGKERENMQLFTEWYRLHHYTGLKYAICTDAVVSCIFLFCLMNQIVRLFVFLI